VHTSWITTRLEAILTLKDHPQIDKPLFRQHDVFPSLEWADVPAAALRRCATN